MSEQEKEKERNKKLNLFSVIWVLFSVPYLFYGIYFFYVQTIPLWFWVYSAIVWSSALFLIIYGPNLRKKKKIPSETKKYKKDNWFLWTLLLITFTFVGSFIMLNFNSLIPFVLISILIVLAWVIYYYYIIFRKEVKL